MNPTALRGKLSWTESLSPFNGIRWQDGEQKLLWSRTNASCKSIVRKTGNILIS
jgi:hypothetical protein